MTTSLRAHAAVLTLAALALIAGGAAAQASTYDQTILNDRPAMFLRMDTPGAGSQADASGNGRAGTYIGGTPALATLPNGDKAADFNGSSQYLTVPASPALSVPTSKQLTVESWIKPDTLQFSHSEGEGYVYWLGKGDPSDGYEYANRVYSKTNTANRPNRVSDYAWNTSGGLGSGAYFQDPMSTSDWIMVTDVIDMKTGYISIYKNGILRGHVPLSQYSVTPGTTKAPFNVGTRNKNSWFQGAVGKVAVYGYALSDAQIAAHYAAMTAAPAPPPPAPAAPVASAVKTSGVTDAAAVVTWTTDKVSHSQVEYGPTASYGSLSYQSNATGTSHWLQLSGLKAGTLYHYRVKSLDDATKLTGLSADYTFTTAGAPAVAPAIAGVAASNVTQTGAVVGWTTDKASLSQVEYGPTAGYGSSTAQTSSPATSHSVALSGLAAGTAYHFRVKSLDPATGLTGVSADQTFKTAAALSAPVATNVAATGVTQTAAAITWLTDKASHSQVEYGPTASYGSLSYQSGATGTSHWIPLSGLKAGTAYHYRVKSLDGATGLTGVSGDYTFTTAGVVAAAPVASNVSAAAANTAATITWSTDKVSHSQVEYGLTASYGAQSYLSGATGTSHWIPLSGLKSGTVYHYRVKSLDDATGLLGVSGDLTFTTPGAVTTPVISNVQAANVTASAAAITWNTTTNSHSQVEYGLTTSYGSQSYLSTAAGTSHYIPLSGLKAGTTYHYRVKSLNSATGKTDVSGDYTFKTAGTAGA